MKYEILFKKIVMQKHGMEVDFEKIEKRLHHLKDGDPLTYDDLLIIGDDNYWPFSEY